MLDQVINIGEQHLRYKLEKWKKTGTFYILNNISEYVKLVQLIHSLVNFESFSKCGWRANFLFK